MNEPKLTQRMTMHREWHEDELAAGGIVLVVRGPEDALRQVAELRAKRNIAGTNGANACG